jgi:hypothetical protein
MLKHQAKDIHIQSCSMLSRRLGRDKAAVHDRILKKRLGKTSSNC